MSRLTEKNAIIFSGRMCGKTLFTKIYDKLWFIEDLMEKYEIEDLVELEIALDQYYHRHDNIQTRRVNNNE